MFRVVDNCFIYEIVLSFVGFFGKYNRKVFGSYVKEQGSFGGNLDLTYMFYIRCFKIILALVSVSGCF